MNKRKLTSLGELMQIAFVTNEFDATIDHWLQMGAGPFFLLRGNTVDWISAYGVEMPLELDIALGNWGDMQIEIIQQKSEGKTIYSNWIEAGMQGVHHTCIMLRDMAEARAICAENGLEIVHEGRHGGSEWIYADTGGGPGTLLEMLYMPEGIMTMAELTASARKGWDGSNPIRELSL